MPIEKPLPLMVGNKAYYSLTSYDPCKITVQVPYATDEDIEMALEMTVAQLDSTMESLDDPAWVSEHFEGLTTRAQVMAAIRQQMSAMSGEAAEEQKLGRCLEVLVSRLVQSVPPQVLAQARESVQMQFVQQLEAEGMTPQLFCARTRTTSQQLEAMFDRQARDTAEADAALSAYAHQKKLRVEDNEIGTYLGIPADQLHQLIDQARQAGQMDELREAALRAKAAHLVVAECDCTYEHETPAQARARVAQYRQMSQMLGAEPPARPTQPDEDSEPPAHGKAGFRLV